MFTVKGSFDHGLELLELYQDQIRMIHQALQKVNSPYAYIIRNVLMALRSGLSDKAPEIMIFYRP